MVYRCLIDQVYTGSITFSQDEFEYPHLPLSLQLSMKYFDNHLVLRSVAY